MWPHCSAVSVGMRSKTARMPWAGEAMLFSSVRPVAWISRSRPMRSCMAAFVTRSVSSCGSSAAKSSSRRALSSSSARAPAGEKSVYSVSRPGKPSSVAVSGCRARRSVT